MRFACDQCNAQYAIADEKVGSKGVRVRCKKCGNIITVRPPQTEQPPADDATSVDRLPEGFPPGDEGQDTGGGTPSQDQFPAGDEDIGNALDAMFGSDSGTAVAGEDIGAEDEDDDLDRQATRVFSLEDMQRVQSEKEVATSQAEQQRQQLAELYQSAAGAAGGGVADEADSERVEWYVAVAEQQLGPMNLLEMRQRYQAGEIDEETLVWKAGFADWMPIHDVADLASWFGSGELASARAEEPPAAAAEHDVGAPSEDWDENFPADEHEALAGEGEDFDSDEYEDEDYSAAHEEDDDLENEQLALGNADVDWQPSSLGELENLAEVELAALRPPPEPEPEEEAGPLEAPGLFDDHEVSGESASGEIDDGDSSIIRQIAEEEEKAARLAEQQRLEEERRAEEARQEEERRQQEAMEAARREREEEQRQKAAAAVPEKVLPVATAKEPLPKWVWGIFAMGGVLIVLLVILIYKLVATPALPVATALGPGSGGATAPLPRVATAPGPTSGVAPTAVTTVGAPAGPGSVAGPPAASAATAAAAPNAATGGEQQAAPGAGTPPATGPAATTPKPAPPPKVAEAETAPQPAPRPAPKPSPKPARTRRHRPRRVASRSRAKYEPKPEPEPPPKPAREKKSRSLLDFEDEAAFAQETGGSGGGRAVAKAVPKTPQKKQLPPLSNADVLAVMRQHLAEFKACNRKQKEIDRSVRGRMVVKFIINPSGKVNSVTVTSPSFKNTFVAQCIQKVIKQARFPAFGGGPKTVPFPFTVK